MRLRRLLAAAAIALAAGCAPAVSYLDPAGPRFAGGYAGRVSPRSLRVVTFNVKYARRPEAAAAVLKHDPRLARADVIALQEMDEQGTDLIAKALAMNYVYYPAGIHPVPDKHFGNAILSPWPLEDDAKLVLPHLGRIRKMARIAVAATVRPGALPPVRVYSVHLGTPSGISGRARRAQAAAIRADAAAHPRAIVAGDFNSEWIVRETFAGDGFRWLTRRVGPTISRFSWDHVAARGFQLLDCASAGAVREARHVSDHRPVWADLVADEDAAVAAAGCP
jgi:endonuclease/exonuclease/phosphatase family metal-dependent hydrolase